MICRRQFLKGSAAMLLLPSILRASPQSVQTAYVNGVIWTGNDAEPLVSAIGINDNIVSAIGQQQVASMTHAKTRVIDLQGAFVMPGFIDNHTHFLMGSQALSRVNLRQADTPEEFTRLIAEVANNNDDGSWIEGGNWDEQRWGGELPQRQWIDQVTPHIPVAVSRSDQHMWLVNSLALKLAGIDRNTPDPAGGVIVRDKAGEPTGILKDKAKDLVQKVIPLPGTEQLQKAFRQGIEHGLSHGVTQVHIKALDWTSHETLLAMRAKGETDMRFNSFVPIQDWEKLAQFVKEEGRGDDWVRWGGLKGLVDGSLGSRTALFHQPYTDDPHTRGITFSDPDDMRQWILDADRHQLHIAVHAIGDYANDMILNMYQDTIHKNGPRDRRFLIEHAQHLTPQAIPRFAQLGVIPSVQPYHAVDDGRWAEKRIGARRLKGTYAFKSLLKAGARISFGSDWPVAPLDPLTGLKAAVLRETIDGANPDGWLPEEKMTMQDSLMAYTVNNAFAGFQEERLGCLAPGYLADFVVLDQNLLKMEPHKIDTTKVLQTVVNGKVRYGSL